MMDMQVVRGTAELALPSVRLDSLSSKRSRTCGVRWSEGAKRTRLSGMNIKHLAVNQCRGIYGAAQIVDKRIRAIQDAAAFTH